jgi:hypothetical protein
MKHKNIYKVLVLSLIATLLSVKHVHCQQEHIYQPLNYPIGLGFEDSVVVKMGTITAGCEIYFTLDGSIPTSNSSKYVAPIVIKETTTVKSVAIKNGVSSTITTDLYVKLISSIMRRDGDKVFASLNSSVFYNLLGQLTPTLRTGFIVLWGTKNSDKTGI